MNRDLTRDSHYSRHLFRIESIFAATDIHAAKEGIRLGDAAIRSLLVKAINQACGREPKKAEGKLSPKDSLLAEAYAGLVAAKTDLKKVIETDGKLVESNETISTAEWIDLLESLRQSVENQNDREPGGRGYLDFLKELVERARGTFQN